MERATPVRRLTNSVPRPIVWVGSSRDDISVFPDEAKASFGLRLFELQRGRMPRDAKPLKGFGGGVQELRDSFGGNAYRVVYVVRLVKAIYVLHAFMKKSKSGIGLPGPDATVIETRLKRARDLDAMEAIR